MVILRRIPFFGHPVHTKTYMPFNYVNIPRVRFKTDLINNRTAAARSRAAIPAVRRNIRRNSWDGPLYTLITLFLRDQIVIKHNSRSRRSKLTLASPASKLLSSSPRSFLACSLSVASASRIFAISVAFSCLGLELTFNIMLDVSALQKYHLI